MIVRGACPTLAFVVRVSVALISFWFAGLFLSMTVTPGGRAAALSAISAVKPGERVAAMVNVAALPGAYDGASSFAVSANGGFSVTAKPIDVYILGGGSGRLAK